MIYRVRRATRAEFKIEEVWTQERNRVTHSITWERKEEKNLGELDLFHTDCLGTRTLSMRFGSEGEGLAFVLF